MMLGNLTVQQIERRLGINFPDDIRKFMKKSHQSNAQIIKKNKWHCFDVPFVIVCGDVEVARKIYSSVKDRSHLVKDKLQFSIQKV